MQQYYLINNVTKQGNEVGKLKVLCSEHEMSAEDRSLYVFFILKFK